MTGEKKMVNMNVSALIKYLALLAVILFALIVSTAAFSISAADNFFMAVANGFVIFIGVIVLAKVFQVVSVGLDFTTDQKILAIGIGGGALAFGVVSLLSNIVQAGLIAIDLGLIEQALTLIMIELLIMAVLTIGFLFANLGIPIRR